MQRFLLAAVVVGLASSCLEAQLANAQVKDAPLKESPPDVPEAIQVPAGEEVVVYAHASGSQIYTCQASAGTDLVGP